MQEELNQKSVALSIKSTKVTAKVLAKGMMLALRHMEKRRRTKQQNRESQQAYKKEKSAEAYKGRQTLKQLAKNGSLQSVEITEKNIKFFEPFARKYNVDYALHKDKSENPPKWLVFFKAKDTDMLTLAFKEFTAKVLQKEEKKRNAPVTFRDLQRKYGKKTINDKKINVGERSSGRRKFAVKSQKKDAEKPVTFKSLQKKFGRNIINNKKVRIRERGDR